MSVSSDVLIVNAARAIADVSNVRWPAATMLTWLNEGQDTICTVVPTANTTVGTITCVAGARQTLPDGGLKVLGVDKIRSTTKSAIDREDPDWQDMTADNTTTHVMFNPMNQREFFTYPPREGTPGTLAGVEYSLLPTAVTTSANITVPDEFGAALTDYMCYRALAEDSDFSDPMKATHFLESFQARIGAIG